VKVRKHAPLALVVGGVVAVAVGLWLLGGLALVLIVGGAAAVAIGLLMEV
jgi:hypothetical protein